MKYRAQETLQQTIQRASLAALIGLLPHYVCFYALATPLWTERIAEWIMARTPSRYAVSILEALGNWAKPSAITGGLATLGCAIFLARLAGNLGATKRQRVSIRLLFGLGFAACLSFLFAYQSVLGNVSFWLPALLFAAFYEPKLSVKPALEDRRTLLATTAKVGLPLVMGSGVVVVAAESYLRDGILAKRSTVPVDMFPFQPPIEREAFGRNLVRTDITPIQQFYGMSKNTVDPVVDVNQWRLTINVDGRPIRRFTYQELLKMGRERRYVTLRCISNTLRSDLMGTAEWAGVHLSQLIEPRLLPSDMIEAVFIGVEGHDDSMSIDYAFGAETLLAIGMNGKTLSRTHGFPIRLLAPRYYGCRNVKWIGEIRFVSKPYRGTWQRLGYTKDPVIHTASHIDRMHRVDSRLRLGGVSFAGSRGIRAVRVRADRGPWQAAHMENPLSNYTWTRWVADLSAKPQAIIEANAQDCHGDWQELAEGNPFPNGPTGPTIVKANV